MYQIDPNSVKKCRCGRFEQVSAISLSGNSLPLVSLVLEEFFSLTAEVSKVRDAVAGLNSLLS